ncbi:hypothetical protein [Hyphomicrobium sp.]|uniref:hypothetical protein n=1 Tax=Hyphomicrobium sp. TaxID=82 RepID=UPI003564EADF
MALGHRGLRLGFASLAAVFAVTAAVKAEGCIDVLSTSDAPDFTTCETVEPEIDFNSAILEQSASEASSAQSDALPWIATNPQDLPAQFSTTDTGVSVRTSLGTWRDYNARSASPTIQQPEYAPAATNFDLPQAPVARKTPVDVWTNIDVEGYDGARDQSTRAGVGADYKFNKTTTFGVSVEHGDARSASTSGVEQDQKASAYVTLQATPLLSLDARTEWQAGNSEFAASSGASERGAVVLAPKINHSFKMDDGTTFSPFLTYEREFDISTSHKEGVDPGFDPAQSAGAGVTYTKPDAYSLSVSADVDNFGATDDSQSLSSKFQLSVPFSK